MSKVADDRGEREKGREAYVYRMEERRQVKRSFRRVPSGRPLLHCASIVVTEIINLSSNHPFPFENSIPNLGIQCPINLKRTYEQTLSLSSRKGGGGYRWATDAEFRDARSLSRRVIDCIMDS